MGLSGGGGGSVSGALPQAPRKIQMVKKIHLKKEGYLVHIIDSGDLMIGDMILSAESALDLCVFIQKNQRLFSSAIKSKCPMIGDGKATHLEIMIRGMGVISVGHGESTYEDR